MILICPQCGKANADTAQRCECRFPLVVETNELEGWFERVRLLLEHAYLSAPTPWQQSGLSASFEDWTRLRIPISESIETSGTFLDVGCANGFLLECLLHWTRKKGVTIKPCGLDYSRKLSELARERLPDFQDNIFVGNAWGWEPPFKFDYVRTEICYVPPKLCKEFISRLLSRFLVADGKLLVAQYRSHREDLSKDWIDDHLSELGFTVKGYKSGFSGDGLELTRVAILERQNT